MLMGDGGVYISCTGSDGRTAREVANLLDSCSIRTWCYGSIPDGAEAYSISARRIARCSIFVMLIDSSESRIEPEFVFQELVYAAEQGRWILPVCIKGALLSRRMALALAGRKIVNMEDKKGHRGTFEEIAYKISKILEQQERLSSMTRGLRTGTPDTPRASGYKDAGQRSSDDSDGIGQEEIKPQAHQQWHEEVIEEVSRTINQRDEAILLLAKAGFPNSRLPPFDTPQIFWSKIFDGIRKGMMTDGLHGLLGAITAMYPGNQKIVRLASRARAGGTDIQQRLTSSVEDGLLDRES